MGTFHTRCRIENAVRRTRSATIPQILVDTGSEYTWVPSKVLERLGVAREKKDVRFVMAKGLNLTVDSRRKKLVAAGPVPAASAIIPMGDK